jgi:large subunit ribosomal protein L31e
MALENDKEERIYTIPLRAVKKVPRTKRAPHAMKVVKKFVTRHMKPFYDEHDMVITDYKIAEKEGKLFIAKEVNELIWQRGIEKPPSKIKVKVLKVLEKGENYGVVDVSLYELD